MEFLIDITLKSTLILLFSGLILLGLKKASATLRHWIISLTMVGLLLFPLLMKLTPNMEVVIPYLPPNEVVSAIKPTVNVPLAVDLPTKNIENTLATTPIPTKFSSLETMEVIGNQDDKVLEKEPASAAVFPFSISQILITIWLVGCLFLLLKFSFGLYLLRKITINSKPFLLPKSLQKYKANRTKRTVRILVNSTIKTPMTWGGFQPVILLPSAAKSWSELELKTVLIHELNHIKRNDYWVHTLGLLAVCFYWYNPLVWVMKRQQLLEREKACDEAVLRAGIRQQNYAEQLVSIARQLSTNRSIIGENALPMAKMSQTKARVLAILNFEEDKFKFSVWKQRNWGLLYVLLFPILAAFSPVGKAFFTKNFDLPKLERISQFLETDRLRSETILPNFLREQAIPILNEEDVLSEERKEEISSANGRELGLLASLSNPNFSLPINPLTEAIKVPKKQLKTGLFGKWKEGKSEFRVWTYGEFKLIPTAPYIEVVSEDGIVRIEEYIDRTFSKKSNQLTITKAPYDCRERPNYNKVLDMGPKALIRKGTAIKIWSENSNYNKWITTKGKRIIQQLAAKKDDYLIKEVGNENNEWWGKIEGIKEWIDFYFMSVPDSEAKIERRKKREALKLGNIPFKKLDYPNKPGQFVVVGNTALSGNNVGNMNTSPKGTQYITVLNGGDKPALVKEFNFHLSVNDFKNLEFDLQLYNLVDGDIKYAITKSPIPITVEKGSGWVKVDLSNYKIVSKGKVLVVLENKDFSGTKNRKKLYFSLTENHQEYQHLISANFEWKTKRILERDFVMYLGVEQAEEALQKIDSQKKSGYLIKWKNDKSTYRVWTYGAFKTHQTAPYIEVLDPNGMVVIEETKDKVVGNKKSLLTITKAPYDGTFIQNFKNGKVNNIKNALKNDPLYIVPANKNWVFLSMDEDEWMIENLPNIFLELGRLTTGSSDYQPTTEEDEEWWSVIKEQQAIKAKRFVPTIADLEGTDELEMSPLLAIPFKAIPPKKLRGGTSKVGRSTVTKTMSGFSGGSANGRRFGTLLNGSKLQSIIKDFNLNIKKHQFESLELDCYFFKIKKNQIQHALTEKPIRIKIGAETGWSSHDLSAHNIRIEDDVLVILEIADYTADDVSLFFSVAPWHIMYKPKDRMYKGKKIEFWDNAFSMYLTVNY